MAPIGSYSGRGVTTISSSDTTPNFLEIIILSIVIPIILVATGLATYLFVMKARSRRLLEHRNEAMREEICIMPMETDPDTRIRQDDWEAATVYSNGKENKEKEIEAETEAETEDDKEWEIVEKRA